MIHFTTKCDDEINILYRTNIRLSMENELLRSQYIEAVDTIQKLKLKTGVHFYPNLVNDAHTIDTEDLKIIRG